MATPFIGEIRMFAGSFAPRGWALCDGQLQAITSNSALFSLFGTQYGGDGRTTFGLPDLRGRAPIHKGQGPGLSARPIGQTSGVEQATVSQDQMPAHNHGGLRASTDAGSETRPVGNVPASDLPVDIYFDNPPSTVPMHVDTVTAAGGGQSHNNVMPFRCLTFIVSLTGIYPSRS